jgi:hypothetical protein
MKYFPKDNFAKPVSGLVSQAVYDDTGYASKLPADGKKIIRYDFLDGFVPPEDVKEAGFITLRIVKDSGLLAPPNCPEDLVIEKTFVKGTEPTEYDPRYLQGGETEIPQITISTDKDIFNVGDQVSITATIAGVTNLDSYKVVFYAYSMPIATLTQPTNTNEYQYKFILNLPGEVNLKVEIQDNNGNILATSSKFIQVKTNP